MAAPALKPKAPEAARLDALRARVASRFRSVAAAGQALHEEVRASTDWRTQARRHPLWAVGIAAGTGLIGAVVLRSGQRRLARRVLGLAAAAVLRRVGRRLARDGRQAGDGMPGR